MVLFICPTIRPKDHAKALTILKRREGQRQARALVLKPHSGMGRKQWGKVGLMWLSGPCWGLEKLLTPAEIRPAQDGSWVERT